MKSIESCYFCIYVAYTVWTYFGFSILEMSLEMSFSHFPIDRELIQSLLRIGFGGPSHK